ncbi:MAG: hypothetical protein KDI13_06870 [Alphaproteobacteria bacterium]|nr:hypothetical protein [Alphaproteobacteria bacterium]
MFTKEEIRRNLLGCFEIMLFIPYGVERFETSRSDAVKSFIITLLLLPPSLLVMAALSQGYSWNLLFSLHTARFFVTMAAFLGAVYFLAKQLGRQEHFFRFVTISNWINIPTVLLCAPIMIGFFIGGDMTVLKNYAIFITMLGYVYCAFVLTHTFRIPWEMGGFIAIVGLAIDQNMLEITTQIRDALT